MIFTVGVTEQYERYFAKQGVPQKKGRDEEYRGGSVWESLEAAQAVVDCDSTGKFSVYGVLADWDKDTVLSDSGFCHDLLRDADLIRL